MKKKMYRIELTTTDTIFTDMVLQAAISNSGRYIPLSKIADSADWLCTKYPTAGKYHTVNRIGNNVLTIDNGTENVLMLTEVEVLELIDEDTPSLNRYAGTGITNETNFENLN
jgi:hypothetical protein